VAGSAIQLSRRSAPRWRVGRPYTDQVRGRAGAPGVGTGQPQAALALLKDLVSVRQRLLVSVDRAKVAAQYTDVTTLRSVAEEIRDAAGELARVLATSEPRRLKSVRSGAG
jgi:hypothetical protein